MGRIDKSKPQEVTFTLSGGIKLWERDKHEVHEYESLSEVKNPENILI